MNASFEEKSAWIQLTSLLVSLGAYFLLAGRMLFEGVDVLPFYVPLFTIAVISIVLINVVGHIAASIMAPDTGKDERDKLIGWRAESNAAWILAVGVLLAIVCMILSVKVVWIAHLLLLALFVSDSVKYTLQLVYYNRGV
ncbi:MAG: hypothetical protein AAF564_22730 [Bacteroidota bacterium]